MVESGVNDPNSPAGLLYALCCKVLGKDPKSQDPSVSERYQYALRLVGSRFAPSVANDEFRVVERIKRKLVKEGKEVDAAVFSELYRKLASQGIIQNKWAILYLILNISEDRKGGQSQRQQADVFFGRGLPIASTSTPASNAIRPVLNTGGYSTVHSSRSSSGIGSVGRTFSDDSQTPSLSGPRQPYTGMQSVRFADNANTYRSEPSQLSSMVAKSLTLSRQQDIASVGRTPGPKAVASFQSYGAGENTSFEVSEAILLREIIYVFQGIEGKIIKLDDATDAYRIDPKLGVPKSVRDLVNKLAELGWLYRKVRKYLDARTGDRALGLVGQSFCAALQQELTEYYRLMAVLEGQQQISDQGIEGEGASGSLTLRRLMVWTFDPLIRLRTLATLVDTCKGKKGGALLSALHTYMQHGDPFVRSLVKHILNLVAHPIRNIMDRWIHDGELEDQYQEFFVAVDYTVGDERLWYDKYTIRKPMLPSFIPLEMATKIQNIGKSINFIRHVCKDRGSVIKDDDKMLDKTKAEKNAAAAQLTADEEFTGTALQETIDLAYKDTSKKLLEILFTKYQFQDHLKALRLYMLLGQGDFIRHLMDLLESDLDKPASTLYMHNLTGVLEAAIRATNAQYENPEILKRLDCRLLEVSPGDTGWDVFSLDYHVDGPISTVFTPECMIHYLRIFNFLWRAKRMEYCLTGIWRNQMVSNRLVNTIPELVPVLHQCHMLGTEMVHFIHQMQYYIAFEVLECCWADLKKQVSEASDLDHIIAAHETFLDHVISRSLLDTESRNMLTQLRAIFDLIVQFQNAQAFLYTAAEDEVQSRQRLKDSVNKKTDKTPVLRFSLAFVKIIHTFHEDLQNFKVVLLKRLGILYFTVGICEYFDVKIRGEWGLTEEDEEEVRRRSVHFVDTIIPDIRAQLRVLFQSYQDMVQQFLMMLTSHQDDNLRFLSFRLDFNEHYKKKEPKLRSPLTHRFSKRYKNR